MAVSSEHLNQTRRKLVDALGDKKDEYFHHMKQWFRARINKEEFDKNARELLPLSCAHLHNEFLLAILTKCQLFSTLQSTSTTSTSSLSHHSEPSRHLIEEKHSDTLSSGGISVRDLGSNLATFHSAPTVDRKPKQQKQRRRNGKGSRPSHDGNFEPISVQEIAPTANLRDPQAIIDAGAGYLSRSMYLLDTGPIKGRLLLGAWDNGLMQVSDSAAQLLQEATQQCLKAVLTAVIKSRRGYKIRESRFQHSVGTTPPNPWLRNTAGLNDWTSESLGLPLGEAMDCGERPLWPTVDAAEQNAAHLASCAPTTHQPLPPISCADLFHALQVNRSVLPCHSVYALGMERISSRLWHPGWGEVEQEAIANQEATLRETIRENRLAANTVS